MDADGSHGVEYLTDLLAAINTHDFVIGSRYVRGGAVENWERWRHGLSYWGNAYARVLTGLPVHDLTAGFYCIRRSLLERMDLDLLTSSGYAFQIDIKCHTYEKGARLAEVPILFKQRRGGESKLSRHIIREGLLSPLRILRRRLSI